MIRTAYSLVLSFVFCMTATAAEPPTATPRSRSFLFTYAATVTGLQPGESARIWLPLAASNDDQEVKIQARDLPVEGKINREPLYGNQILYVEAKAGADGTIPLKIVYRVTRREVRAAQGDMQDEQAEKIARFLQADAREGPRAATR